LCNAFAHKVIVDDGAVASGVEFSVDGTLHVARLALGGEVLLAGGALLSPQLLMLSGIGPEEHLTKHGIKVVSPLGGVGENLQDHPAANVAFECPNTRKGISPSSGFKFVFGKKIPHPAWILRWFFFKSGVLTSPGCDHGGFFHTSAAPKADSVSPDLQLRFVPVRAVTADGMNSFAKFRDVRHLPDGFSFQSIAVRPQSRGHVRLGSCNAFDKPIIDGGYLSDKRDVETIREGIRLSRRLAQQPAFKEFIGPEIFPGHEVQSDEQLDTYIASTIHTANALVGTCRMGRSDDPLAVCDSQMKVIGIKGLRVCDASVMPKLPGGQSGAATVMIAERASTMILRELGFSAEKASFARNPQ
jgi:choline dehydrogenase-like flavoprotein